MSKKHATAAKVTNSQVASPQPAKVDALVHLGGAIAHELNNALISVQGNLQVLCERLDALQDAPPQIMSSLASTNRGILRIAGLANRLQGATVTRSFDRKLISAQETLRKLAGEIEKSAGDLVSTRIQLADDLWSIETDPRQLAFAMQHLANNAVEAMPDGGVLEIAAQNIVIEPSQAPASTVGPGAYVVVTIADNGEGMTEEVQRQAYELFFTTRSAQGRLGLGLSQVYNLLKWSGGQVRIVSGPNAGTRVELYFPRTHVAAATKTPTHGKAVEGIILIVEDDDDVREHLLDTLGTLDYVAVAVPDPQKALRYLELGETRFALLLTDVNLPGMDGLELARRARKLCPDLGTLIMSGSLAALRRDTMEPDERIRYVSKPMSKAELAEHITYLLASRMEPAT